MNNSININTDDIAPKMDVHMGVHSASMAPYLNERRELVFGLKLDMQPEIARPIRSIPMADHIAFELVHQGALGRAIEETDERRRRAKGIKKIKGPTGLITWPTVVVRPGKPRGLRRR